MSIDPPTHAGGFPLPIHSPIIMRSFCLDVDGTPRIDYTIEVSEALELSICWSILGTLGRSAELLQRAKLPTVGLPVAIEGEVMSHPLRLGAGVYIVIAPRRN